MQTASVQEPLVAAGRNEPEFTFRAVFIGLLLATILGAANAYLGLKAGMTVAATFPAAVIAMAIFRLPGMRGTILEQNITRTTATVGEALVAAAIFTVPAFVMATVDGHPIWAQFDYWQSVLILGVGGVLGLLFIIVMRRSLLNDPALPYPESYACFELVRAGQGGASGARDVFGAMGLGMLIELFKNHAGIALIQDTRNLQLNLGSKSFSIATPLASPAIISVGYIIGAQYSMLACAGGALTWLIIIPLCIWFGHDGALQSLSAVDATDYVWIHQVRPIAVGAMLLASLHTLWEMRTSIASAFRQAFARGARLQRSTASRVERDLPLRACLTIALLLCVPLSLLFYMYTHNVLATILLSLLMVVLGFLLSVIGGWLCGLVGSSNQPVSGLTLTALIIAAGMLFMLHLAGASGVAACLILAVIICSASALSGTLIQELKVGQLLGATPWKMELAQIIGTLIVAIVSVYPMVLLHESTIATNIAAGLAPIGIGGDTLPAPQAALMAQVVTAIMGGDINWLLIAAGMGLTAFMLVLRIPGSMVVAVGMYLGFETSAAMFIGGLMKYFFDRRAARALPTEGQRIVAQNRGVLLASGFIAGEALTGIVLAGVVMLFLRLGELDPEHLGYLAKSLSLTALINGTGSLPLYDQIGGVLSIGLFIFIGWMLVRLPLRKRS